MKKFFIYFPISISIFFIFITHASPEDSEVGTLYTTVPKQSDSKSNEHENQDINLDDNEKQSTSGFVLRNPEIFEDSPSSFVQLGGGLFQPTSKLDLESSHYSYQYSPQALQTYLLEVAYQQHLLVFLGTWSIKPSLGYTVLRSRLQEKGRLNHYLHLIPLGLSFQYDAQYFERQWLIPFVNAGITKFFYFQTGQTDTAYADGSTTQPQYNVGTKLALNHILNFIFPSSLMPSISLEIAYRHILEPFDKTQQNNFSQKYLLVGVSLGL
ncbi:MAG: hypothetical protein HYS98_06685 [Deltaproteobacteria bacterium]|nr:hypothetical protein [Deltaproteobacteria bacterium]